MGQATFLKHSLVLVQECNKVRLSLITGGLPTPYCRLTADQHCSVEPQQQSETGYSYLLKARGLEIAAPCQTWSASGECNTSKMIFKNNCYAPLSFFLLVSAHSASEYPSTIGLLRWLQPSLHTNPNTSIVAAQEGRAGHCKQTRRWQDVTQIYLHSP